MTHKTNAHAPTRRPPASPSVANHGVGIDHGAAAAGGAPAQTRRPNAPRSRRSDWNQRTCLASGARHNRPLLTRRVHTQGEMRKLLCDPWRPRGNPHTEQHRAGDKLKQQPSRKRVLLERRARNLMQILVRIRAVCMRPRPLADVRRVNFRCISFYQPSGPGPGPGAGSLGAASPRS